MSISFLSKLRFLLCATLIAPLCLFAQLTNQTDANGKKQGPWKKYDKEGKLKYEGQFKDDKPTGKFTYYYPTGKVKTESVFSNNGTITRTKSYDEVNGKLMAVGKYVNEKKDSVWTYYNVDQVVIATEIYTNGIKTGTWKSYYPDGKLLEVKTYKNGLLDGPWEQYFESGAIRTKATYVKDKLDGVATYYQGEKLKVAEGRFVKGLREGNWNYFKPDGSIEKTEKYKNGELVGGPQLKKDPKDTGTKPPPKQEEE